MDLLRRPLSEYHGATTRRAISPLRHVRGTREVVNVAMSSILTRQGWLGGVESAIWLDGIATRLRYGPRGRVATQTKALVHSDDYWCLAPKC